MRTIMNLTRYVQYLNVTLPHLTTPQVLHLSLEGQV